MKRTELYHAYIGVAQMSLMVSNIHTMIQSLIILRRNEDKSQCKN